MSEKIDTQATALTLKMLQDAMDRATKNIVVDLQYSLIYGPDWKSFLNPITYKSKGFQKWTRHQVYCHGIKIGTIYE